MTNEEYKEQANTALEKLCRDAVYERTHEDASVRRAHLMQVCMKTVALMSVGIQSKSGLIALQLEFFRRVDMDYAEFSAEQDASAAIQEAAR